MHDFNHGLACVIALMLLGEVLDLKKLKQWPQRFMIIHEFPSMLQDVQHKNELS
jgi:hypothetical protein